MEVAPGLRRVGKPDGRVTCKARAMGILKRIAPIFPARDLDAAMAHYRRLGFVTREYEGGRCAFATRGGIEIHLGHVPDSHSWKGAAYLWVEDADDLAAVWRSRVSVIHPPEDTESGQREDAAVDPDGNV